MPAPYETTTPTLELELAPRLRLAITRLARRLRQQSLEGLSPSQTSALSSISRHGALTPSELAQVERIQRPTATRVIAALEDAGLVRRESDALDRRLTRVRLTPAGDTSLRRGRSRKNAYLAKRLRRLEPEELKMLEQAAEVLERLIEDEEAHRR